MTKKRKTLPKNFRELIERGNIEELKAVYDKCELTAYTGYNKGNAFFCPHIPAEFVYWLAEQGLDINSRDCREATPLHVQARYANCCIETFLELGADIHATDISGETPLHQAAAGRNAGAVKCLLEHGARIDAVDTMHGWTPLEEMLAICMNIDIVKTAEAAEVFLEAGAEISESARRRVERIGEGFEFQKDNFNKNYLEETVNGLNRLYELFDVKPASSRKVHDGISPIIVTARHWQQQHNELWEILVPGNGHAATIQGEVIRISGLVSNEILDNGGMNWDKDYRNMLKMLQRLFRTGNALSEQEMAEADSCIELASDQLQEEAAEKLCELAVHWVIANPEPIRLSDLPYRRKETLIVRRTDGGKQGVTGK